jgi:penicillin-binding protein 1A
MNKLAEKPIMAIKSAARWYKGIFKGRPWYIKILSALGTLVVAFFLYLIMVDINFLWLFS